MSQSTEVNQAPERLEERLSKGRRILVYTAIFGGKDKMPQLVNRDFVSQRDIEFVCVTDNPNLKSQDYEMLVTETKFDDVAKNARFIKLNGIGDMQKYDVAIWHDSSLWLDCKKLEELIAFAELNMISVFHHVRYCAYLEAIACIDARKDDPIRILRQMMHYFLEGFPSNFQLHETGILVLRSKEFFKSKLQKIWWEEIEKRSRRDQISLPYARWKSNETVGLLDHWSVSAHSNQYSKWIGHEHSNYESKRQWSLEGVDFARKICKKLIFEMRRRR